jgi:hypothetical protein
MTELIITKMLKESEFGVSFIRTVEQILATITERILMEEIDGCRFLEKVGVVLHHYIEFNLREALQTYGELRPNLADFVGEVRQDRESTAIRVRTWEAIERILAQLAADGVRFLGIVADGIERI